MKCERKRKDSSTELQVHLRNSDGSDISRKTHANHSPDGRALIPVSRANLPDPGETPHSVKSNTPDRASMHQFETAEMAPLQPISRASLPDLEERPHLLNNNPESASMQHFETAEMVPLEPVTLRGIYRQKRSATGGVELTPNMASFPPSDSLVHNNGNVPLQTGFSPAAASPSKDLRRKRQMEEAEFSDSISPTSTRFSDLAFAGPGNFASDSFSQSSELYPMGIQATAPPNGDSFSGAMDPYTLGYFFNS